MAIHVARQWTGTVTVNETDAVVPVQETTEVAVDVGVQGLVLLGHGVDRPGIEIVERTKIRSAPGKWNGNMRENDVGRDCMILKRII